MSVQYAVRAIALADVQISALLSTRWYPKPLPESMNTYPAVDYQKIDSIPSTSHNNIDRTLIAPGFAKTRLQLTLWAATDSQRQTLRDHLARVLRDFKGTAGSPAIRIDRIAWDSERDDYDATVQKHLCFIDLMIQHATTN